MPPPRHLLASKIQGFVCRPCLSRLRVLQNSAPIWQGRFVASDNGPLHTKIPERRQLAHAHYGERKPIVRMFEETLDGIRSEVKLSPAQPEDEALLESLQSKIEDVGKQMAEGEELDDEKIQDEAIEKQIEGMFGGEEFEEYILSQMERLNEEVERRMEGIKVENSTPEEYRLERSKIREELLERYKTTGFSLAAPQSGTSELLSPSPMQQGFLIDISQFHEADLQLPITSLNNLLMEAVKHLDKGFSSKMAKDTMRLYSRCRSALLSQPNAIPIGVWQLLWSILADTNPGPNRSLLALGDDMIHLGIPLQKSQQLFYIQAIFAANEQNLAIEQWENMEIGPEDDLDLVSGYWRLGASMYCQTHQLDKALSASKSIIELSKDSADCRVLLPMIEAFLSSTAEKKEQKAWALYVRLRLGLGSQIEMKDYDAVVSMFFDAFEPHLALAVFRDMMLTGHESAGEYDSIVRYKNGPGVEKDSDLMRIGESGRGWDNAENLSQLPAKFNNKFFFGKWLKKLIAEGKYDESVKVFNLMHERGIRADPLYLNGLVGAWLRSGLTQNHRMAEETAWRMIEQRISYVKDGETAAKFRFPLRPSTWADKASYKGIWKHPNATIETFAILIEDYRRRQRHDRMRDIFAALVEAKIQPNTYFMNQMIMVNSEAQQHWAWDMYSIFTRTYHVNPNFDTFEYLWYHAKQAIHPTHYHRNMRRTISKNFDNSAVCRIMFAEMIRWESTLKQQEMPRKTYDMIIECFSLSQDHVGTMIALRALQRYFNMYPNEDTVRVVVLQLARASITIQKGRKRRFNLNKSADVKDRVTQVVNVLDSLKIQRIDALLKQGIVFEELGENAKLEEALLLLIKVLWQIIEVRVEEGKSLAQLLDDAALEMGGVEDCTPVTD